jgi:hypothetical protein
MGRRFLPRSGTEQEVMSSWGRRYLCYLQRPGVKAGVKRGYRRRERAVAKAEIRNGRGDGARD